MSHQHRASGTAVNVAFLGFIVLIPLSRTLPNLANLVLVGVAVGVVVDAVRTNTIIVSRAQHRILILLAVTIIWHIATTATANVPVKHLFTVKTSIMFGIVVLAATQIMWHFNRTRRVFAVITASAASVGVLTLAQVLVDHPLGKTEGAPRAFGPITFHVNRSLGVQIPHGMFGMLAALGLAFACGLLWRPRSLYPDRNPVRVRYTAVVAANAILVGVLLGQSRSTWLAMAVLVVVIGAAIAATKLPPRMVIVGCGGLGIAIAGVAKSVLLNITITHTASIAHRIQQVVTGVELLLANPVFGTGAGYFRQVMNGFILHNFWLLLGVWTGIPGLLVWGAIFVALAARISRFIQSDYRRQQALGVILAGGLAGCLVELILFPGFTDTTALLIAMIIGPSFATESEEE